MGRKPKERPAGTVRWHPGVLAMPTDKIEDLRRLSFETRRDQGDYLREWILAGLTRELKKVNGKK